MRLATYAKTMLVTMKMSAGQVDQPTERIKVIDLAGQKVK